MKIALIGNQNCGKTTLFNRLTGSNQHVGNFPGVTVDAKIGVLLKDATIEVVDLPGIYSLSPYSNEEIVTRDFLLQQKPDCILNILDATNIERNLYLTLQLMELEIPMVIALNLMDEVTRSGNMIDVHNLKKRLGLEIVPISATRNEGIGELFDKIKTVSQKKMIPFLCDFCVSSSPVHRAIHATMTLIEDHAEQVKLPLRFASTRIIEGDAILLEQLRLSENECEIIVHLVQEMEQDGDMDREALMAEMRYDFIDQVCAESVIRKNNKTKEQLRSDKIDRFLLHRYLAYPLFVLIMGLVFFMTFGWLGYYASEGFGLLIDQGIDWVAKILADAGFHVVMRSLVVDGILTGIGSVLSFLPTIVILFFFLSLLEDTGYMARVAFLMDKPLRKIGLSGRSFVPLLIGFGCSVPAIMGTRTLTSDRDRKLTMLLIPFMSCTAKIPIYIALCSVFFSKQAGWVIVGLYAIGIFLSIVVAAFTKVMIKGKPIPFLMELPAYRFPSMKTTGLLMFEKAKDFLRKAFTVIFIASLCIWFLQSFDAHFYFIDETMPHATSLLEAMAKSISGFFIPMGLGQWQMTAALLTGLTAKETVLSTLGVLYGSIEALRQVLTPLQAFSMLIFILLYMPCIASFAAMKKELRSIFEAVCMMVFQTCFAWLIATAFYQVGSLFL